MSSESNIEIPSSRGEPTKSVNWLEVVTILWNSRRFIAILTGSVTVLSVIVSLLLPEYYKSTATLLPETEKSKIAGLGGLTDLAALAGVNLGADGSLAKLYPTIIKSEAVLKNVIYAQYQMKRFKEPVNLIEFWEINDPREDRKYETALKALRDELQVSLDNKTGVVTLSIETREPVLSATIVNNVTGELDRFIRTKRTTNAGEQRKWIEARLETVKEDLEKSENALREFREKNRRIGDSPQLLLQQGRLMREVEINSTMYIELKKQYEITKIEEIKNLPIISVMDPGRPAAGRERPRRTVMVATTFIVMFALSCGAAYGAKKYESSLERLLIFFRSLKVART